MSTLTWILVGLAVNMIVGAGVYAAIDTDDQQWFIWYRDCPPEVAWFVQPLVLELWPIGLWLWYQDTRQ